MPQPVGDFTHSLGGRKNWPGTSAVDAQGAVASTDTAYCIAGRAAHLNSSGQFEAGVKGFQMPSPGEVNNQQTFSTLKPCK